MAGLGKKPPLMCSDDFRIMFDAVSKAALIDALWCACQLGTDESPEQIQTQAARNVVAALRARFDSVPRSIVESSDLVIDSD